MILNRMCRILKFKNCLALFEEYPCQQKSPRSAAQGNGACGCVAVWLGPIIDTHPRLFINFQFHTTLIDKTQTEESASLTSSPFPLLLLLLFLLLLLLLLLLLPLLLLLVLLLLLLLLPLLLLLLFLLLLVFPICLLLLLLFYLLTYLFSSY